MRSRSALITVRSGGVSWDACAQAEEATAEMMSVGKSIRLMVCLSLSWLADIVDATERCAVPVASTMSANRSEEHTSELQSRLHLVCRLLLEKKKTKKINRKSRPKKRTREHVWQIVSRRYRRNDRTVVDCECQSLRRTDTINTHSNSDEHRCL